MDPQQNQVPTMTPPTFEPQEKSIGPAIGIIIIILVIVLGGLYFWGRRIENRIPPPVAPTETTEASTEPTNVPTDSQVQATVQTIQSQGNTDDMSSIEADLSATNIDGLGSELNAINTEAGTQ